MGTRHLVICKIDKKVKVANYGQWDGHLDGQGLTIAEFIQNLNKTHFYLNDFKDKLKDRVFFLSKSQLDTIDSVIQESTEKYGMERPRQFSRDTGANILSIISQHYGKLGLINSLDFGNNELSCEYSYVLDFDKDILEIYLGGPKKKNLFKKLKFKDVTTDKMLELNKQLDEKVG